MICQGGTFVFGSEYPDLIEPVFFDSSVAICRDRYPFVVSSSPGNTSMISIKALVQTVPALCNFHMIARRKGLGGGFGFILPHTARERLHNAGVSASTVRQPPQPSRGK
jgi:hypothetical protein